MCVGCVWCIQKSWDVAKHPLKSLNEIDEVNKYPTDFVVIGGEPSMHDNPFHSRTKIH